MYVGLGQAFVPQGPLQCVEYNDAGFCNVFLCLDGVTTAAAPSMCPGQSAGPPLPVPLPAAAAAGIAPAASVNLATWFQQNQNIVIGIAALVAGMIVLKSVFK